MERRDGKSQHHPIPDPVERFEMMQRVWELRREHVPYREIGEELGISDKTAIKYFREYTGYQIPPAVEQDRILHLQQVEEYLTECHRLLKRAASVEDKLKVLAELRAWMKDYRRFIGIEGDKRVTKRHVHSTEFDEEMKDLEAEFGDFAERVERAATKEREQRRGRFRS